MKSVSKKGIWKHILLILSICLLMAGCGEKKAAGDGTEETRQDAGAIADVVEIPEDGIITAKQFESFAGTDREIQFHGEAENGISYTWSYTGTNIKNPQDVNLQVTFTTDRSEMKKIAEEAGNPPYLLGVKLHDKGQVAAPTLTVELNEKWNAVSPVFCVEQDGVAAKESDVVLGEQEKHTTLSMKISVSGCQCYIMAGEGAKESKKSGDKAEGITEAESEDASEAGDYAEEETITDYDGEEAEDTEGLEETEALEETEPVSHTCTFSIDCSAILNNMDDLKSGKEEFVPSNGAIFAASEVEFTPGDNVFDVLQSVCREYGIHMEHAYTPIYGSEYIEGINQLYEFDCGELSGWMYSVNGWFPNYGCDQYTVEDGDVIEWIYTCDLGADAGGNMGGN